MPKRFSTKDLTVTTAPSWPGTGIGTFRFTDHYSVFHFGQMPDPIPGKGGAIATMAAFNFELLAREGVEHHFRRQLSPTELEVELFPVLDPVSIDLATHRGAYFIPLQVIARNGVPPGSSLLRRGVDARFAPHPVTGANEFREGEVFPTPLVEFTTKLEEIDRFIGLEEAQRLAGVDESGLAAVSSLATQINQVLAARAGELGLELADGKVEFGRRHNGEIVLVDVAGTGDDNRFLLDGFHIGKQVMRDHYASTGLEREVQRWAALGRPAELAPRPAQAPQELLTLVSEMYRALAQTWTGQPCRDCRDLDQIIDDVRAWVA